MLQNNEKSAEDLKAEKIVEQAMRSCQRSDSRLQSR